LLAAAIDKLSAAFPASLLPDFHHRSTFGKARFQPDKAQDKNMKTPGVTERILLFNQGRQPDLLQMKLKKLCDDAFVFLRGTCHLFYEAWPTDSVLPAESVLNEAPRVWLCGDLHLENFGSYKGDNRLVYFDINDFDEAVLAPCTWDVARLLTSLLVGADSLKIKKRDARALCQVYLDAYCQALAAGRARWVERETATGMVRDLLESLRKRRRKDFLKERTKVVDGKRRFRTDPSRLLPASKTERARIKEFWKPWAAQQTDPRFFRLHDVARRIAGTGSLGVDRYSLLVEGNGSPNDNYVLDLKEARPSALLPATQKLRLSQPDWPDEAARIIAVKERVQSTPPALLTTVEFADKPFILCELQPTQDRVNLSDCDGDLKQLRPILKTMGELTAWGQLRSSGRQGSAGADELIAFAQGQQWQQELLGQAQKCHEQVVADYQAYRAAFERGLVGGRQAKVV
jgi:uncharacterized protein (DUF2252 family)